MKRNDYPEFWSKCCHSSYGINWQPGAKLLYQCNACGAPCEVEYAKSDKDILVAKGVIKY